MTDLRKDILSLEPTKRDKIVDERTALVDGIYMSNHPIRKRMLSHIWAKYNMLPDVLTDSLGRLYDVMSDVYTPDKNFKSLYDYTHDNTTVFSRSIKEKNLTVASGNILENVSETPKEKYKAWYNTRFEGKDYEEHSESFHGALNISNPVNRDRILYSYNEGDSENSSGIIDSDINIETINYNKPSKPAPNYKNLTKPKRSNFSNDEEYKKAKKEYDNAKKLNKENLKEYTKEYNDFINGVGKYNPNPSSLLEKTSKLFSEHKIDTLIGRFHSSKDTTGVEYIDSTKTQYGNSHGRSLLRKKGVEKINGYDNPFCRAWTYHHQYHKYGDTIRPFKNDIEESSLMKSVREINGGKYLNENSVMHNGLLRITPEKVDGSDVYNTKKCMFSIENLAWKDVLKEKNLSKEQIGPNGGRIMWFPPYDLKFQENVAIDWNENNFIGRGEPIYTYTNTKRMGTLDFTMLIDYPSVINKFKYSPDIKDDDDILRFFAGSDIPMKMGEYKIKETKENNTNTNNESVKETTNKSGNSIQFTYSFNNNEEKIIYENKDFSTSDFKKILYEKNIDEYECNLLVFSLYEHEILTTKIKSYIQKNIGANGKINTEIVYDNIENKVIVEISYNLPSIEKIYNTHKSLKTLSSDKLKQVDYVFEEYKDSEGYENEADYFEKIKEENSFAYQRIIEKIKYFEPAYHSISPEGFNSRLNFLHQCTRQGNTIERSNTDKNNLYSVAGNLAFGRAPFCVLRIGDFINTKILIRSMSITYDNGGGIQWDLNPEGIGVQPMYARVSLNIEIIGGQSLDAPVTKLNNAISFNYYANTGVYDKRSIKATYKGDEIEYSNIWTPEK